MDRDGAKPGTQPVRFPDVGKSMVCFDEDRLGHILGVVEAAAYYAYVNRIADGLGVELEEPGG